MRHNPYEAALQPTQFETDTFPDGYELAGNEEVRILPSADYAQQDFQPAVVTDRATGRQLEGRHVASLRLGKDQEAATDIRIVETGGQVLLALPSPDGRGDEVHELRRGAAPLTIGRGRQPDGRPNVGALVPGMLSEAVSRDHCSASFAGEDGAIVITNHNPTFQTKLMRPAEIHAADQDSENERRREAVLDRLPEGIDRAVVRHNLSLMLGGRSAMDNLVEGESVGGNAGAAEIDGKRYMCTAANGRIKPGSTKIVAFGNPQHLPEDLVAATNNFTYRIAVGEPRRPTAEDPRYFGFNRIIEVIYADERKGVQPVGEVEMAADELQAAAAAYNELQ